VRRSGVRRHEPKGWARGRRSDMALEGRRNAPPESPGKHGSSDGRDEAVARVGDGDNRISLKKVVELSQRGDPLFAKTSLRYDTVN